ncbi:uncharacterized protein LOC141667492 isoform X2 [Apium graveolens]|uniref:uncharacterized protein LOC141667492 isoform X2 n=1 Tax=Apium graveolens TaxID=4045 RepID=UPI003D791ED8
MEVGVESPEKGVTVNAIAMDFPVYDHGNTICSPPMIPPRIRRRLSENKSYSPSSVEEIEAKLRHADLRRQKFYENLSSKARPKPRSPLQSPSRDEDLGQRLEAKLQAAEQKRRSLLDKSKMRLAKLDELRQAAKTSVEMRYKKERAELGTKVESRVKKAEANRMLILKSYCQRRATLKERTKQSLSRRIARDSKYKQRVHAAICQKRAAAERKRLVLLEADKTRAAARLLQVREVANSVSQKREVERRTLKDKLEDRLQRAKRQRAEYIMQRARIQNSIPVNWIKRQQADYLSRKLARCWKRFLKTRRTTLDLTRAYDVLNLNESRVKTMPFEQLALLIESASTLRTAKGVLDRLESRLKVSKAVSSTANFCALNDISHLLKRVASPSKRATPKRPGRSNDAKKQGSVRGTTKVPAELSRYQVRVVLCAYMILGHPDAVFSGRSEREHALALSAEKFIEEFELLVKIILDGPLHSSDEESDPASTRRWTFRSQLTAFDAAWCAYLNSFVVWKVKDAESLEEDLVRAACHLELSMMQKCKPTQGDSITLTHDLKAIQKQVTEDQKLLREKVMHLSGGAGIQRMENALSDTRTKYFQAVENESSAGFPPVTHILSPSVAMQPMPGSSAGSSSDGSLGKDLVTQRGERPSHVVRSLFKEDGVVSRKENAIPARSEELASENELMVNEIIHEPRHIFDAAHATEEIHDSIQEKLRAAMEKVFWNSVTDTLKQDNYERVVELVKEVRDELCNIAPQSWKQEITEAIDVDMIGQVLNSGTVDMNYLGKILESALVTLQKLSAAANEDELKETHNNLLKELAELCYDGDGSKYSHVIALVKGLRFILEQIQVLKQEISRARVRLMEPLLKGPAGLEYLEKAFVKRYGPPSGALTSLPLTTQWILSVWENRDQEWGDHTTALSDLRNRNGASGQILVPSTTLRTGGNLSARTTGSQVASFSLDAQDYRQLECKGEKIDLLVRLGLLQLANQVSGLTEEVMPETLKLNFIRLRAVQAQVQKIIVVAVSILVLRQTLLSEQIVKNAGDMDNVISSCGDKVSALVDTVEDAGVEEIIDILSKLVEKYDISTDTVKSQSRRSVMGRMLVKSLQPGDAVFDRVSRAIYLAARGAVLGDMEGHGRILTENSLKKIGAAVLTDRVIEAAKVLVIVATVSVNVHGLWYSKIIENM